MKVPHLRWPGSVRLAPAWHHSMKSYAFPLADEKSERVTLMEVGVTCPFSLVAPIRHWTFRLCPPFTLFSDAVPIGLDDDIP